MNNIQKGKLIKECIKKMNSERQYFEVVLEGVRAFFSKNDRLNASPLPAVHSVKGRIKSEISLREKILRKWPTKGPIEPNNLYQKITDIAGVRVLHLHSNQFPAINEEIQKMIANKTWFHVEEPKAYSWDPESILRMESLF
jgi:putative GTP pyrophosphokinase